MTPAEILSQARSQFDDPNSTFITDAEGYAYIWQGLYELCAQSDIIEVKQTKTTVNGTADYSFNFLPTNGGTLLVQDFIKIKMVTWDENILFRRDLEKFQQIVGPTASSGSPQWYRYFNNTMTLTPTPTSAKTLLVYGTGRPAEITANTANDDLFHSFGFEEAFQQDVIDYVLMRMYYKDDDQKAIEHRTLWEAHLKRITLEQKQIEYMDNHTTVTTTDDDAFPWSFF